MNSATAGVVDGVEVFAEEALLVPDPAGGKHVDEGVEEGKHHVPWATQAPTG